MQRFQKFLAIIGATALLVLGINGITEAANGGSLKIGKSNKGSKMTTLKRTKNGPALRLDVNNPGDPPFTTDGSGLVENLNADFVRGEGLVPLVHADTAETTEDQLYMVRVRDSGTFLVSISARVKPKASGAAASEANPIQMVCGLANGLLGDYILSAADTYMGSYWASPSASSVLELSAGDYYLNCSTSDGAGWEVDDSGLFDVDGYGPTISLLKFPNAARYELD